MHKEPVHHSPQRRSAAAYRKKQMKLIRELDQKNRMLIEAHVNATRKIHRALGGIRKMEHKKK